MLRILFWKLGFEWANLKRLVWPGPESKIYYFAFGANLSEKVLTKRQITVYESFDYQLIDTCLRFSQRGFYRNHGYASADSDSGQVTYGRMYLIKQSDARRMDYFEGVPFLQVHQKIFGSVRGFPFYYYCAINPRTGLKPTAEYLDYLVSAYRVMPDVPQAYVERLAAHNTLEEFLPQNQTGEFVRNIDRWPQTLHPALMFYEGFCLRLVEFLWNRSLVQWMIR